MTLDSPGLQRIVDAAADLFFRHGYEGTSMQHIAEATGLHKSSLYHHIQSKAELLELICGSALESLFASLDEATTMAGTPGERVVHAFHGAATVALGNIRAVSVALHLKDDVAAGKKVWARRREYDQRFAELIREAQLAGQVRDDIDAPLLTRLVFGMINWVIEWYRPGQGRYDEAEVTRSLTGFMRQGILPPSTS